MTMRAGCGLSAAVLLLGELCAGAASAGGIHIPWSGSYIFVPAVPASGVRPNALPFTDTFDQYPVPFWFEPPTNGWKQSASYGDASHTVPVTELPLVPGGAALFSGNCLNLETEGQDLYNVTTGRAQNIWVDLSALMVPCEEPPWEELTSGRQLGFFVNAVSNFTAFCGLSNRFASSDILVPHDRAVRLTLQLAYDDSLSVPFFKVYIDQVAVHWSAGYRLPDVPAAGGGEWLPCATASRLFCGLGFNGCGTVDTLTFSASNLGPDLPAQAGISQAVAVSWPSDYGRSYQVEACTNLTSGAWQPLGAPVLGNGTTNTVFDADVSAPSKFYRVTAPE